MLRRARDVHAARSLKRAAIQCRLPMMARQKTIRARALPDPSPRDRAPQGGTATIDVAFVDLTPQANRPRRAKSKSAFRPGEFIAMSALSAAAVVLGGMALLARLAVAAPG
jgi:hypothetical protein